MEKDRIRCKELRETDRRISRQIGEVVESLHRAEDTLNAQNSELRGLNRKREDLLKRRLRLLATSVLARKRGAALGAMDTKLSIQIDTLDYEISQMRMKADRTAETITRLRQQQDYWQDKLHENAGRLSALNCVV